MLYPSIYIYMYIAAKYSENRRQRPDLYEKELSTVSIILGWVNAHSKLSVGSCHTNTMTENLNKQVCTAKLSS